MRAVWSFWSRPFDLHYRHNWGSPLNHLLAWVVSVHAAAQHYPDTMLVTDSAGKALLVDRLGLPFRHVSTELDRLDSYDPGWWSLGKLVAYGLQTVPFVHIDTDAFLWKRLPAALEQAPLLAQHPEHYALDQDIYRPQDIEHAIGEENGVLPVEWEWARSRGPALRAENCGIVGGQDVAFLRHYAQSAVALVERPENAAAWRRLPDKWRYNFVVEQFFLAACLGYHRFRADSPHRGIRAQYLFASWDEALDPNQAAKVGYTHLMAGAKRSPDVARRLLARVRRDQPDYARRCEQCAETMGA